MEDPAKIFRLDGRVAVVTGASSGLGSHFAETLALAGASVVLAARRTDRLAERTERIRELGGSAIMVRCDVTSHDDARQLAETVLQELGRVDVLVNNAGVAAEEKPDPESIDSFRWVTEVNLIGAYACAREIGREMVTAGRGSIINLASIGGLVAEAGGDTPSYAATKGGIVNLTRDLAIRWAPHGVRVNALAPAWFPTEMTAAELQTEERQQFVAQRTPLGRPGRIEELDGPLLFLASDSSSYVTGHTLPVDGGWVAR